MKAFKLSNLLIISMVLFFFYGCEKTISLKQAGVSEEQKGVEKQVMVILTSMDEAASQLDWGKLISLVDEYYADDIIIRGEDPNRKDRGIQTITLEQVRFMLGRAHAVIFNYKYRYKNRKIEVAPDGRSAKVTARRMETITMDRRVAAMFSAHLFKDKDTATVEPEVTIKNEEQVTMMFEYREGKLLVTQIDSKVIKTELI